MATQVDLNRTTGLVTLGMHTFKILRFSEEMGSSGYPYWSYAVACVDQKGDDRGKEALLMVSLSPKARFKLDEFLDAMNAPKTGKASGEQFVGKLFRADIIHKEFEGKLRTNFNTLISYDGQLAMEIGGEEPQAEESSSNLPDDVVERPARRDPF